MSQHCPVHPDQGQSIARLKIQMATGPWLALILGGLVLLHPNPGLNASLAQPLLRILFLWVEARSFPAVTIGGRGATLHPGPREVRGG